MARLILLNGGPASGKSTLARRYVDDHPLALALDIDVLRSMLGHWRDDPMGAGLAARAIAIAAADVHLRAGHDVIVPQFLARADFVEQLEHCAAAADVTFVELLVRSRVDDGVRRYAARAVNSERHEDARPLAASDPVPVASLYESLDMFMRTRPGAIAFDSVDGDIEATYHALLQALQLSGRRVRMS